MDEVEDSPSSSGARRWPVAVVGFLVLLMVVTVVAVGAARSGDRRPTAGGTFVPVPAASPSPSASPSAPAEQAVTLSATGDIIMGDAPERLPPDGGRGFFDQVRSALAADLVMGNLEQPLTDDTGTGKCPPESTKCHQFRAPPGYAAHLRDAGFELLNQANNHGNDYGPVGYRNTQKALEAHGLRHTGAPGQITVAEAGQVSVAVVGFSSYPWNNSLVDIEAATKLVERAATMADLVVVQVHMGAEGSDKSRVRPGTEMFLGENRGDPVRFSHAVVEAGADLVVGHGPHVLRGVEFHQGRLIAYSLGNFSGGGGTLNRSGPLGLGAILKVSLRPDGSFAGGELVSTYLDGAGRPVVDRSRRGLALVRQLNRSDFPSTGARLDATGAITAPTGG